MTQQMQLGSQVGTVVGVDPGDDGNLANLHPRDSEAGQGLLIAVAAFVLLIATVGKSATGATGKLLTVGTFVLIVAAASVVAHWAARTVVIRHPMAPGAAGVSIVF